MTRSRLTVQIVDLDRAEMQLVGIGSQDAQAPDGERPNRQGANRKRSEGERSHRH